MTPTLSLAAAEASPFSAAVGGIADVERLDQAKPVYESTRPWLNNLKWIGLYARGKCRGCHNGSGVGQRPNVAHRPAPFAHCSVPLCLRYLGAALACRAKLTASGAAITVDRTEREDTRCKSS